MTEKVQTVFKEWIVPMLAALITAGTIYAWGFDAMFNSRVEAGKPAMRQEVQEMLEHQKLEMERDRLEMMNRLDRRLSNMEGILEELRAHRN